MTASDIRILGIAPFRFLPLRNGGNQAIAKLHHYIGMHCADHVVSTVGNGENPFSFQLHKVFPEHRRRYLPFNGLGKVVRIAKEQGCTHIICEHPYMALTAIAVSDKLGIPWYLRSHNIEAERYRGFGKPFWPALRVFEKYAMQKANGIFFITPEDAQWSIDNYGISADKCHDIPFGTDLQQLPGGYNQAREQLAAELNLRKDIPWLYFLGALDYSPNAAAVQYIIEEVQPRLLAKGKDFEIIIAGAGLSQELQDKIKASKNIIYPGFVNDLEVLLKGCDIMLNPVMKGGGVKTKAIEALGYNNTVVSSVSGATGLQQNVCGSKLHVLPDFDWDAFTDATINAMNTRTDTPQLFYDTYYHGRIAEKVISILKNSKY